MALREYLPIVPPAYSTLETVTIYEDHSGVHRWRFNASNGCIFAF